MNPPTAATISDAQAEADRLAAEARKHKRLQRQHRRESAKAMQALDDFRRRCEDAGIPVIIESQPEGTDQ